MGSSKVTKVSVKSPALACKLGDIRFSPSITKPLGGINPYCPQFDIIGSQLFNLLIEHAKLKQTSRLLDIGCGTGRLAKPISKFSQANCYTGIEVNRYFLEYCVSTYTELSFIYQDIKHEEYNPEGIITTDKPLDILDESYDIVACFGLFNHLKTDNVYHYIAEASRILKPGGILVCTAILLNDYSINQIDNKLTKRPFEFNHRTEISWHEFEDRPLLNVAIYELPLRRVMMANKLQIKEPIRYGNWCNNSLALSGHDIIIARKNGWGV